jgi:hypothetical protein
MYKMDHKRDKIGVFVSIVSTKIPFKVRTHVFRAVCPTEATGLCFPCQKPKFLPYGSVCCACAQRPGLLRQSFSRTLRSQKGYYFFNGSNT